MSKQAGKPITPTNDMLNKRLDNYYANHGAGPTAVLDGKGGFKLFPPMPPRVSETSLEGQAIIQEFRQTMAYQGFNTQRDGDKIKVTSSSGLNTCEVIVPIEDVIPFKDCVIDSIKADYDRYMRLTTHE